MILLRWKTCKKLLTVVYSDLVMLEVISEFGFVVILCLKFAWLNSVHIPDDLIEKLIESVYVKSLVVFTNSEKCVAFK